MSTLTKVAVITGAGKGIGKSISVGLAGMNFQTILIGRDKTDLVNVSNIILKNLGIEPVLLDFDITDSEKVRKAIQQIIKDWGRIDVLVNNAGVYFDGSTSISENDFRTMLETNLTAQFVFLQEVVPVMKKQKSGYIFNVASRAGKVGFAGSGAYNASKFGLVGLSESLYRELVPLGIKVTALCPGWVNTKMAVEAGTTLAEGQMIQPEDLFKTVKLLLELSSGSCVKEIVFETPFSIS